MRTGDVVWSVSASRASGIGFESAPFREAGPSRALHPKGRKIGWQMPRKDGVGGWLQLEWGALSLASGSDGAGRPWVNSQISAAYSAIKITGLAVHSLEIYTPSARRDA